MISQQFTKRSPSASTMRPPAVTRMTRQKIISHFSQLKVVELCMQSFTKLVTDYWKFA